MTELVPSPTDPVAPSVGVGVLQRWAAPLVAGASVGALVVLREAAHAHVLQQWMVIGLVGIGLSVTIAGAVGDSPQDVERQLKAAMNTELVDGNLKLAKNRGQIRIEGNTLGGDLFVVDNTTDDLLLARNQVRGNVQVNKTRGASEIAFNTISKKLQCTDNTPWPVSVANVATEQAGQCALGAP